MRAWIAAFAVTSIILGVGPAVARGRSHPSHHVHHRRRHRSAPEPVKLPEPSPAEKSAPRASSNDAPPVAHHGPTRIDFDDRLIQGQTNKAGAVYLYDRKELKVRSMVHLRESFRQEIYEDAYGAR